MRAMIALLLVVFSPFVVTAADPTIGDTVFLRDGVNGKIGNTVVDRQFLSFPAIVGDVNGEWLWLDRAWVRKGDVMFTQEALDYFTEYVRQRPTDANGWAGRGSVWSAMGQFDKAIKDYTESIRLNPSNPFIFNCRGNAWNSKGDLDNAIKDFTEGIRLNPQLAGTYLNRAMSSWSKGDVDAAIRDCTDSIRLDPQSAMAYNNRAALWKDKRDIDRALKDYTEAIRLNQKFALAYRNRAAIWQQKGEFENAITDYTISIRLEPMTSYGYRGIAWLKATCPDDRYRDGTQAVEYAKKACKLTSGWEFWNTLSTLAAAYAETGDFTHAIELQKKAVESAPESEKKAFSERLALYQENKPYRETLRK